MNFITLLLFVVNLASDRLIRDEPGWYVFSVVCGLKIFAKPHRSTFNARVGVAGVTVVRT